MGRWEDSPYNASLHALETPTRTVVDQMDMVSSVSLKASLRFTADFIITIVNNTLRYKSTASNYSHIYIVLIVHIDCVHAFESTLSAVLGTVGST